MMFRGEAIPEESCQPEDEGATEEERMHDTDTHTGIGGATERAKAEKEWTAEMRR